MTAPIKPQHGPYARLNTPRKQREDSIERMAEQYRQGAAQSDIEGEAMDKSVNVPREYDLLQRATRKKRSVNYKAP